MAVIHRTPIHSAMIVSTNIFAFGVHEMLQILIDIVMHNQYNSKSCKIVYNRETHGFSGSQKLLGNWTPMGPQKPLT